MKKIMYLLGQFLEDFLILSGLVLLTFTTYSVSSLAGNFLLSAILISLGVVLARRR